MAHLNVTTWNMVVRETSDFLGVSLSQVPQVTVGMLACQTYRGGEVQM